MRAADIELLLPEVLRRTVVRDSPMAALVGVMEAMHAPAEEAVRSFPTALDPLVTPERFVGMLAGWVDLARLGETPAGRIDSARMRLLVSLAADIASWRGTPGGLMWLLGMATGVSGLRLEQAGPFAVRVVVPAASAAQADLVRAIAAQEKPAHLVVEVVVDGAPDPRVVAGPAATPVVDPAVPPVAAPVVAPVAAPVVAPVAAPAVDPDATTVHPAVVAPPTTAQAVRTTAPPAATVQAFPPPPATTVQAFPPPPAATVQAFPAPAGGRTR